MVTYTFTFVAIASASCRVFNTFCDPAVLWLYLQYKWSLCWYICNILRSLYIMNELATMAKGLHSNRWKAFLVLPSQENYNIWFDYIVASAFFGPFQTWFINAQTCDIFFIWKASWSCRPDLFHSNCNINHILMWVLEWSSVWNRKVLTCKTKPIVCKNKQNQMQPLFQQAWIDGIIVTN